MVSRDAETGCRMDLLGDAFDGSCGWLGNFSQCDIFSISMATMGLNRPDPSKSIAVVVILAASTIS